MYSTKAIEFVQTTALGMVDLDMLHAQIECEQTHHCLSDTALGLITGTLKLELCNHDYLHNA